MNFIFNSILFFALLSCGNQQQNLPEPVDTDENNATAILFPSVEDSMNNEPIQDNTLTTSGNMPEDIDGCSCYFSETEELFESNLYFFASDYDSSGFIWIDNEWVKLKLQSSGRQPDTFGDYDHVDIYVNEFYKVTADIRYKNSSGDETWINTGTITIETDGDKTVKEFVGECGC